MGDLLYKTEKCAVGISKMLVISPFIPSSTSSQNACPKSEKKDFSSDHDKSLYTQDLQFIITECMKRFHSELRSTIAELGNGQLMNSKKLLRNTSPRAMINGNNKSSYTTESHKSDDLNTNVPLLNSPKSVISTVSTPKRSNGSNADTSYISPNDLCKTTKSDNYGYVQGDERTASNQASQKLVEMSNQYASPNRTILVKNSQEKVEGKLGNSDVNSQEKKDINEQQRTIYRNVYYCNNNVDSEQVNRRSTAAEQVQSQLGSSHNKAIAATLPGNVEKSANEFERNRLPAFNTNNFVSMVPAPQMAAFPRQSTFQSGNCPTIGEINTAEYLPRVVSASNAPIYINPNKSSGSQTRIRVKNFSEIPSPLKMPPYIQQMKVIQDPNMPYLPNSHNPGYPGAFVDIGQFPIMNGPDMNPPHMPPNPMMMNAIIANPANFNLPCSYLPSISGSPTSSSPPTWTSQGQHVQNLIPIAVHPDQMAHMPLNRTEVQQFYPPQNNQSIPCRKPSAELWVPRWKAARALTSELPNKLDNANQNNAMKLEGQGANPNFRKPKMSSPALCGIMGF